MSPAEDPNRSMPSAHDAERALLNLMLQGADAILPRLRWLTPLHFHLPAHATIWSEMVRTADEGKPIDFVGIQQALSDQNKLHEVGGAGALAEIMTLSANPGHLNFYVDLLREKHARREGLASLWNVQAALWDEGTPYTQALTTAQAALFDLQKTDNQRREFQAVRPVVLEALDDIQAIIRKKGHVTGGIATGFTDLDRLLMGLKPGQVFIIAGRPAMGKTSMMMNIAENIATGSGHFAEFDQMAMPTAVVSLEMGASELMQRMLLGRAKVSLLRLRDGFTTQGAMKQITSASADIAKSPLHILDTSGLDIATLGSLLRQFVVAHGIKVVCVDYLQLLKSTSRAAQGNRYVEVGEVSRGLKALAKELGVALLVAAQIGRSAEERKDAVPRLSDLRESGDIENDADIIGLLHRPCYYASENDKEDTSNDDLYTESVNGPRIEKANLIIAKHRGGPVGTIPLGWRGELARFESLRDKLNSNNSSEQQH